MSGNKSLHLIPAVWEQRKLGEVANVVGGGTPSTGVTEYWDGDINWFAPAELSGQRYASQSVKKITRAGLESCSAKMLAPGTVLFTSRAGIGTTAILSEPACTNQGFQSIVPHEGQLDSYFVYSMTPQLKKYGETKGAGSTFVEVSGKQMSAMPIMLPKIFDEQKAIGGFFQSLDDTIVLHQRESFSSTQAGKRPHDEVDVLVLELLDDVEIDLLGGGHAGVPKTPGDAGDRHPGVEQERGVGVPEAVHGDDRDAQIPAVAGQNAVHRRVVDLPVHEDWLIVGQILQGLGELGDDLPVDLDLPHGGLVLRRHEAVLALVVVGFVDREGLVGEVEVLGGHRQRLGEAHSGLGNQ
jgi:hypothetical protein